MMVVREEGSCLYARRRVGGRGGASKRVEELQRRDSTHRAPLVARFGKEIACVSQVFASLTSSLALLKAQVSYRD